MVQVDHLVREVAGGEATGGAIPVVADDNIPSSTADDVRSPLKVDWTSDKIRPKGADKPIQSILALPTDEKGVRRLPKAARKSTGYPKAAHKSTGWIRKLSTLAPGGKKDKGEAKIGKKRIRGGLLSKQRPLPPDSSSSSSRDFVPRKIKNRSPGAKVSARKSTNGSARAKAMSSASIEIICLDSCSSTSEDESEYKRCKAIKSSSRDIPDNCAGQVEEKVINASNDVDNGRREENDIPQSLTIETNRATSDDNIGTGKFDASPTATSVRVPEEEATSFQDANARDKVGTDEAQEKEAQSASSAGETYEDQVYDKVPLAPWSVVCWSCDIPLQKRPGKPANERNKEDDLQEELGWNGQSIAWLYPIHAHPLLNICVCSKCAENGYAVEDDAQEIIAFKEENAKQDGEKNEPTDEMEACSLCAVEASDEGLKGPTLVCCDRCPRTFCLRCIEVLNGGDAKAREYVSKIISDEKEDWACPSCDKPSYLNAMQSAFLSWANEGHVQSADDEKEKDTDSSCFEVDPDAETKSIGALIEELNLAEDGLREAEMALEANSERRANAKAEVSAESRRCHPEISESDLDHMIESEMEEWSMQWQDHHTCLSSIVVTLQEALEVRGIDIAAVYKDREENILKSTGSDSTDGKEPNYIKAAEAELDKRDEADGFRRGEFKGSSGYKMDANIAFLDIEDLDRSEVKEIVDINTVEGTIAQLKHLCQQSKENSGGWATTTVSEADIESFQRRALRKDDEELSRLQIDIRNLERNAHNEKDDASRERKQRRQESAYRKTGGPRISIQELSLQKAKKKCASRNRKRGYLKRPDQTEQNGAGIGGQKNGDGKKPLKRRVALETVSPKSVPIRPIASAFIPIHSLSRYGDEVDIETPEITTPFEDSNLVLCTIDDAEAKSKSITKRISVAKPFAEILKQHQIEGVKFMWEKTCSDLFSAEPGTEKIDVSGCILAHNMGLGKSIQLIVFLHTLLAHPALSRAPTKPNYAPNQSKASIHGSLAPTTGHLKSSRLINRALLVVPVNTIANWEKEWQKWTAREGSRAVTPVAFFNLNRVGSGYHRFDMIMRWCEVGGVLLISKGIFATIVSDKAAKKAMGYSGLEVTPRSISPTEGYREAIKAALLDPGPDIVCLDEGHQMLKNRTTAISKALSAMNRCKRRVILTGTPFQNSLTEYYRMATWVRPSCGLGNEADFDRNYTAPVMAGMAKDATPAELIAHDARLKDLQNILDGFVQRRDADVLAKDLLPMQQVVLNLRQSKLQTMLGRAFALYEKQPGVDSNFFDRLHKLRPVNNHPALLLLKGKIDSGQATLAASSTEASPKTLPTKGGSKVSSTTSAVTDNYNPNEGNERENWWARVHEKNPDLDGKWGWESGYKIVLLLQILCYADMIGDKVVVFTQCLKTLDYIETILSTLSWEKKLPILSSISPGKTWGPWRKNIEYLRIDGAVGASERGDLITTFNTTNAVDSLTNLDLENQAKVFLISKEAGGMGINLCAANRVILFDSHWNPSVDLQSIYRCYRYGQSKPVFAYRFLTEGSMEEKIYSRSVNKSSLSARVIDKRYPERSFNQRELDDIMATDTWVQCDICEKWRMIPPYADFDPSSLPDEWFCSLNEFDKPRSNCEAKERDAKWYGDYFLRQRAKELRKKMALDPKHGHQEMSQGPTESQPSQLESELRESVGVKVIDQDKAELTKRDDILQHLLHSSKCGEESQKKGNAKSATLGRYISNFHFHDTLLGDSEMEKERAKKQEDVRRNAPRAKDISVAMEESKKVLPADASCDVPDMNGNTNIKNSFASKIFAKIEDAITSATKSSPKGKAQSSENTNADDKDHNSSSLTDHHSKDTDGEHGNGKQESPPITSGVVTESAPRRPEKKQSKRSRDSVLEETKEEVKAVGEVAEKRQKISSYRERGHYVVDLLDDADSECDEFLGVLV